jgi:hypothetical protein
LFIAQSQLVLFAFEGALSAIPIEGRAGFSLMNDSKQNIGVW